MILGDENFLSLVYELGFDLHDGNGFNSNYDNF